MTAGEGMEGLSEVLPSASFPFSLYRRAPAKGNDTACNENTRDGVKQKSKRQHNSCKKQKQKRRKRKKRKRQINYDEGEISWMKIKREQNVMSNSGGKDEMNDITVCLYPQKCL